MVHSGMRTITGTDRSQSLLLPAAVEDYVAPDNPVRFIDAFVDGLDLAALGFVRAAPKATGRPGYHPGDLLKLYIYGYLNRIRSSRRLEAETHRNLEVIWLMRQLRPDFKTIADFRRQNRDAFAKVFRRFVLLCRDLDLFGRDLIAVDGTRIKAVNNKDRNFTRASLRKFIESAEAKLADYLQRLDNGDAAEQGATDPADPNLAAKIAAIKAKRDQRKALLDELDRTGEAQISLTDPDSRAMAGHTRTGVGYNVQCAVDAKNKLIVDQQVTNNVVDMGLLEQASASAKDILGVDRIDVVADSGYYRAEDIEACEKNGLIPHVPRPKRGSSVSNGRFGREMFRYDRDRDLYICPGGADLAPNRKGKLRDMDRIGYTNAAACKVCELRKRCTTGMERRVHRLENEDALDRMEARLKARPGLKLIRHSTVEHPFGSIKQWMNQGAFLMRRLENVRGEFSLTALAYNIRRAITLVGIPALIEAVRA